MCVFVWKKTVFELHVSKMRGTLKERLLASAVALFFLFFCERTVSSFVVLFSGNG